MDVVRTSIRIGAKRQSLLCCLPYREDGGPRYSVTAWQGGYAKDEALRSAELTRSAFGVAEEKDQVGGRWLGRSVLPSGGGAVRAGLRGPGEGAPSFSASELGRSGSCWPVVRGRKRSGTAVVS